jgi:hypothetical protein
VRENDGGGYKNMKNRYQTEERQGRGMGGDQRGTHQGKNRSSSGKNHLISINTFIIAKKRSKCHSHPLYQDIL